MKKRFAWLQNTRLRRQGMALLSGALILAGLAAGNLVGLPALAGGLYLAAALVAGWDIALRAWNSLRNRHVSIELLVTIAAVGALVIGEYWEAAAVTFLFIFGAYLEARTLSRTRQVLRDLFDLAPVTALVIREGQQVEVRPNQVEPGEMVLVKPGAKISVDGEVIEGLSVVDESAITGEPIPEEKGPGSQVFAGTVNQAGMLKVRATGTGSDTTLARIIRRVEEAQEAKAPAQRFMERFARWYTPFIIGLSAIAFLITRDLELALTLLVIGCPGALVISTPVSIVAGIGRAAKEGILIKGGEYLENAGKISALALDKTGTITQGEPQVTEILVLEPERTLVQAGMPASPAQPYLEASPNADGSWTEAQREVLYWAAIAEANSEHPLARAILTGQESSQLLIPDADSFETFTGRGVRAAYQGRTIELGTEAFLQESGIRYEPHMHSEQSRLQSAGRTVVGLALDGELLGLLGISDPLRPAAPEMIQRAREIGIRKIVMLTGDDKQTAQAIARGAGIRDVRAGLLPDEKLAAIHDLQQQGYVVAMSGDGINDAPALAAADIGIAMGVAGTDIAIETADIALMADDLMKIPQAIHLSKATLRNIRQNVAIALVTVSALLLGVLLGEVHMAGGMLIHEASVLVVILNGMRLLRNQEV